MTESLAPARYVALLRGINAGGHAKVAMADLRAAVAALGHTDVATYINSGNVVFTAGGSETPRHAIPRLAADVERAVAGLGVPTRVIVRDAVSFGADADANPYAAEPDPKRVHVVFFAAAQEQAVLDHAAAAQATEQAAGSSDEIAFARDVAYVPTPDGFGRSKLAELLRRRGGAMTLGTARNLSTVTRLREMLQA
jgi:uncharacterized protein (DUF1697 family)